VRILVTLQGAFRRISLDSFPIKRIELEDWLEPIYQMAADAGIHSHQRIQSSFGLQFLSLSSSPMLFDRDRFPDRLGAGISPIFYQYSFCSGDREIPLCPTDMQIPDYWPFEIHSLDGRYQYEIELRNSSSHDNLLYRLAHQYWNNLTSLERLRLALRSGQGWEFRFSIPEHSSLTAIAYLTDLSPAEREALQYIDNPDDAPDLSTEVRDIVRNYYDGERPDIPDDLEPNFSSDLEARLVIGKGNSRSQLERLIDSAETFLFVSSYVIEDESIAALIARKATTLPEGVWILTDVEDRMLDRRGRYESVIEKKKTCLSLLLTSGANLRGGSFHLKSIITEKEAYLGSSNLTGGSLDFNLEAGMIGRGIFHQDLYRYFVHCWRFKAQYDFIIGQNSFIRRDLDEIPSFAPFQSSCLLEEANYRRDLLTELRQSTERVTIYSRGVQCDRELSLLLRHCQVNLYVDAAVYSGYNLPFARSFRRGQHAKITLLDNRVAYLGGINFFFNESLSGLQDLMYKITDSALVARIRTFLNSID
jgi:phosphatidylserine/phosphatidylglycerophosphate/cardiolipin synthase-like enzyme